MEREAKRAKYAVERIQILDESTGQIMFKDETRLIQSDINDQYKDAIIIQDELEDTTNLRLLTSFDCRSNNRNGLLNENKSTFGSNVDFIQNTPVQFLDESQHNSSLPSTMIIKKAALRTTAANNMSILLVESPSSPVATKNPSSSNNVETTPPPMSNSVTNHERMVAYDSASSSNTNYFDVGEHQVVSTSTTKRQQILTLTNISNSTSQMTTNMPSQISQNYAILTQEITNSSAVSATPRLPRVTLVRSKETRLKSTLNCKRLMPSPSPKSTINHDHTARLLISTHHNENRCRQDSSVSPNRVTPQSSKEIATCQFCGRAMLKKNIPTHIRRAHTPKEELVCLDEEHHIFTFQHLKPGQRRRRSIRSYDYSQMIATVHIDEDPSEGIENKFVTEGEEISSVDLQQLGDRIRYGVSQIASDILNKLVEVLAKIEANTEGEIRSNAKSIKSMIWNYLKSDEVFKYKLRQVSEEIGRKRRLVSDLRTDLKEIMSRKTQLERRIQPMVCELQKLEDKHSDLVESIFVSATAGSSSSSIGIYNHHHHHHHHHTSDAAATAAFC